MEATTKNNVLTFIERYKLHHILFWACYHFAWWTVYTGSPSEVLETLGATHSIIKYFGYVLYQAVGVYFCLYILMPRYLITGKYLQFFAYVILVVLTMAVLISSNYFLAASFTDSSAYQLFNIDPASPITLFKKNALPSCISTMTLGMSIKLAKNWVASQKRQQLLEKEKLETELKFLKSQFNPHFLFNTINSIFVLINKNPEMASDSLVKFSSLLRYQLYECNSNYIYLRSELEYIESFIELESLRQNENFTLELDLPKLLEDEPIIAPFILIPFIENAFKHLSEDESLKKWVSLHISYENGALHFELSNSANFEVQHQLPKDTSFNGLGLKNVKRRLYLVYKDAHSLIIKKSKDVYTVKLQVTLTKEVMVPLKKISIQ